MESSAQKATVTDLNLYRVRERDKHVGRLNRALFLILRSAEKGRMGRIDYINSLIQPDAEWMRRHDRKGYEEEVVRKVW